jgi:hypothetical protein
MHTDSFANLLIQAFDRREDRRRQLRTLAQTFRPAVDDLLATLNQIVYGGMAEIGASDPSNELADPDIAQEWWLEAPGREQRLRLFLQLNRDQIKFVVHSHDRPFAHPDAWDPYVRSTEPIENESPAVVLRKLAELLLETVGLYEYASLAASHSSYLLVAP